MKNIILIILFAFSAFIAKSNTLDVLIEKHILNGEYDKCFSLYENEAKKLPLNTYSDSIYYYKIQNYIAIVYTNIGDYKKAIELYDNTFNELDKTNKISDIQTDAASILGVLYYNLGYFEKAISYSTTAKFGYEYIQDFSYEYEKTLLNLSLSYYQLGDRFNAKVYNNVAVDYAIRNNKYKKTDGNAEYYRTLLLRCLASWINMNGDDPYLKEKAQEYASLLVQLRNPQTDFDVCTALSYYYFGLGDYKTSLDYIYTAGKHCNNSFDKERNNTNIELLLWLLSDSQYEKYAKESLTNSNNKIIDYFSFFGESDRSEYWKTESKYYDIHLRFLIESESNNDFVYNCLLTKKGLLIRTSNTIKKYIEESNNLEYINTFHQIKEYKKQQLNELDKENNRKFKEKVDALELKLTSSIPALKDQLSKSDINWNDIKSSLTSNDIAIEFLYLQNDSYLDSLKKTNFKSSYYALTLKSGYKSPHLIKITDEALLDSLDSKKHFTSSELYNLIWKPLESEIGSSKNVYFSVDNELHNIGIEYALDNNGKRFNDKYNAYRLSSTRVLAERKTHTPSGKAVLYGGLQYNVNPTEMTGQSELYTSEQKELRGCDADITDLMTRDGIEISKRLKYLPGTKKEVENISNQMKSTNKYEPILYINADGVEESVKNLSGKKIDILHFATHGLFVSNKKNNNSVVQQLLNREQNYTAEDISMHSGLIMSGIYTSGKKGRPSGSDDGYLMAKEIAELDFTNVDLVVLSACSAGRGKTGGDGVFGLQRGFKLAGVNTLLMPLWSVSDMATMVLMTSFYEYLLAGHTKVESLKLAQEKVRNTVDAWKSPEYWAGFILLDGLD